MELPIRKVNGYAIVDIKGDLDSLENSEKLKETLNKLFIEEGEEKIVLNLDSTSVINNSGIGRILMFRKKLREGGGSLYITPPKGLVKDDMSIQARMMAIADIFEALTARDRPYKKGKTLSQAMRILGFMKNDAHIDPDLFDIFIKEQIFNQYAQDYLDPSQIDEVQI